MLAAFQNVAHKFDLQEAVEMGVLYPVRCIRVKTNINMSDVRINGFKYNFLDLEETIMVPDRNKLIVDTYLEYVNGKSTVIFCTSVNHANTIAELLRQQGVKAEAVSGSTTKFKRDNILNDYADKKIQVFCACDLLNEGWDSPITEVLFMARPTMSKTIYMQQLGRGMRTHQGKDFLMVFDFVDNANMFNCPYSIHRLLNIGHYVPGGLVLGKKHDIEWDNDMFRKGDKPTVLIDYPIHVMDYGVIDIFNWQDKAQAIREAARASIGSHMPAKELELKHTVKLIQELDSEINEIEIRIIEIMDEMDTPILTIPGISYRMGAMILAEIGDFERFSSPDKTSPDKILAYAGLSLSTYRSGQLTSTHSHMEKRGSRYLRYALFNATKFVCNWAPDFSDYLEKKRKEGKHYNVAISHACKKLVRVIYHLQTTGEEYDP